MKEHPQAEILRAIADGKTVQIFQGENVWVDASLKCLCNHPNGVFRIKPETMSINGMEFPAPVRKPLEKGQEYWIAALEDISVVGAATWSDDTHDFRWLKRGLIQRTEEGAIAQAKAMIAAVGGEG